MSPYEWLSSLRCNSFTLGKNDDHAANYMTASNWIDENLPDFDQVPEAEIKAMRETNTIWTLQIYPDTPIGFYTWHASSMDAVIRMAMEDMK